MSESGPPTASESDPSAASEPAVEAADGPPGEPTGSDGIRLTRRSFLVGALAAGAGAMAFRGGAFVTGNGGVDLDPWLDGSLDPVGDRQGGPAGSGHWLGPQFWGNRLQDWRRRDDRIECLRGEAGYELRTAGVLTREVVRGDDPGHLRVTTGPADGAADGFCGVLLGAGSGDLDYRAAALCQRASGIGGGFLCTLTTGGEVQFREHTNEAEPLRYERLAADTQRSGGPGFRVSADDEVELVLDILPRGQGRFDVQCKAVDAATGAVFASAIRRGVPEDELLGGIALVSSPPQGSAGARWWFRDLETAGPKLAHHPERTFGPIAGTLFSLDGDTLKLTAQLLPVGEDAPQEVTLRRRAADGGWVTVDRETLGPGYTALFREDDWDASHPREYRVRYVDGDGQRWSYEGRIPADPGSTGECTIGLLSCTISTARNLDGGTVRGRPNDGRVVGRYTDANVYFPFGTLVENLRAQDPDLLAFVGDQIYEHSPTRPERGDDPGLDYLYKWLLWLWSFRDLTRDTPTVVLTDDHDVYQPNLWGAGGREAPNEAAKRGGYVYSPAFVNRAQRVQCGHNPDPYDPEPVGQDIEVYYGSFEYGGTSFAFLEDRKFKTPPPTWPGQLRRALLGERQIRFLDDWGDDTGPPKICLTQTVFASVLTDPDGEPLADYDTNAFPTAARDRAIESLREAGALVLAGDQHLGTLVRHGVDSHVDGVVQFAGPAGGAIYQRWFEPAGGLANRRAGPNTGRFTDAFGNRVRVLAVANPKLPFGAYREYYDSGQTLYDRRLKSEGYGIVRVDHDEEAFVIECWPWNVDPSAGDAGQFDGWPYYLPFEEADGRRLD